MSRHKQWLIEGQGGAFRRGLLQWFDAHHRQLPWRHCEDPYAVWVSEIMLQQTQVATVIDYFERWMERFPSAQVLAEANLEEVLELWSGLGYYRRARYLHRAARVVVEEFGGSLPRTVPELRKLPGIGPYTAGAIASIAFGQVEPLVDGNVERVISRLFALSGDPKKGETRRAIWALAAELVDPKRPGDFNQALMELGAMVCSVSHPACGGCPVSQWCAAHQSGQAEAFPQTARRSTPKPMRARACVVYCGRRPWRQFLLRRRPEQGLLAGLWEFPSCERHGTSWPSLGELRERLGALPGLTVAKGQIGRTVGEVEHIFSHRRLQLRVHELELAEPIEVPGESWRWVAQRELAEVASASLFEKVHRAWPGSSGPAPGGASGDHK